MNQILNPDFSNKEKCISCGKQATKLCDIVTGHIMTTSKEIGLWNTTCDNPICDKCSIHLNEYMDICPDCIAKILKAGGGFKK
ncbi:hypothetical protein [Desulfosporosinus shakirovi]|uniref:hypothetical protein n=1 Tax=Desulfosporosinus shakirovi TaxID=2885154 RepID=UPI001E44F6D4|nr:hypothetical protein [Desulfosporosinus sp. SRJS8]MCB8818676.1 hypothetical protein [Desulfosporosinus sp. SRJS8]